MFYFCYLDFEISWGKLWDGRGQQEEGEGKEEEQEDDFCALLHRGHLRSKFDTLSYQTKALIDASFSFTKVSQHITLYKA